MTTDFDHDAQELIEAFKEFAADTAGVSVETPDGGKLGADVPSSELVMPYQPPAAGSRIADEQAAYVYKVAVRLAAVLDQVEEMLPKINAATEQAGPMLESLTSHPLARMFLR